jgi:phenylacetate-CoA ligase
MLKSLTKETFPGVLYRTHGLTGLLPDAAPNMRAMEKVIGLTDDMMLLHSMNVFPTQIEEALMTTPGPSPHVQIDLMRAAHLDEIRVLTEASPNAVDVLAPPVSAHSLRLRVKEGVGLAVQISLGAPGSVARSDGKAVRIIDNCPKH